MEPGNIFRFISHDDLLYPASVGPSSATGTAKLHHLFWSPRNGTWLWWFRRWPRRSKAAAYSAFIEAGAKAKKADAGPALCRLSEHPFRFISN